VTRHQCDRGQTAIKSSRPCADTNVGSGSVISPNNAKVIKRGGKRHRRNECGKVGNGCSDQHMGDYLFSLLSLSFFLLFTQKLSFTQRYFLFPNFERGTERCRCLYVELLVFSPLFLASPLLLHTHSRSFHVIVHLDIIVFF
jgi:hypothetical protein